MSDEPEHAILRNFELITKFGAVGLAFLYLCGFLVVMVHLSAYGVYSIAPLRGQYLAAGVLSLGPLCLTFFIFARLHTTFEGFPFGLLPVSGWSGLKHLFELVFIIFWEAMSIFAVCSFLIDGFASIFAPSVRDILLTHWRVFSWITLQSVLLIYFVIRTWHIGTSPNTHDAQGIRKTFPFALGIVISLFFFFVYLSYFARHIYAEIPFAIGGGRPQAVVFLMKQNRDGAVFPAASDSSNARSIPYKLILETDSTYTVLSGIASESAIQFNHDAVTGYIILGAQ